MKACSRPMGARFISDRRSVTKGAGALALALFCVLLIAFAQRFGWLDGINVGLMTLAGEGRDTGPGGTVTMVMRLASAIGGTLGRITLLAVVLAPLIWAGHRRSAMWLAGMMAVGTLLNLALKQAFAAPRPDLLPHLDLVHTYSFPSGHSAGNMMFFGALAMLAGRRGAYWGAAVVILLIGVSRVWLGVHWPSDVLAGWVEGLGWLAFCAIWLPARGGKQQCARDAAVRRHSVAGNEAVDPETVERAARGDQR